MLHATFFLIFAAISEDVWTEKFDKLCSEHAWKNWHHTSTPSDLKPLEDNAASTVGVTNFQHECNRWASETVCNYFAIGTSEQQCKDFCVELNKIENPSGTQPLKCAYMSIRSKDGEFHCFPVRTGWCDTPMNDKTRFETDVTYALNEDLSIHERQGEWDQMWPELGGRLCGEKGRTVNWHSSTPSEELMNAQHQAAKRAHMVLWDIDGEEFGYKCMQPDWYCGYFIRASKPEHCRNFCLELNKIPQELNPLRCDYMMIRNSSRRYGNFGWGFEQICLPVQTGQCETEYDPDSRTCAENPSGCFSEITWKRRQYTNRQALTWVSKTCRRKTQQVMNTEENHIKFENLLAQLEDYCDDQKFETLRKKAFRYAKLEHSSTRFRKTCRSVMQLKRRWRKVCKDV